MILSITYLFHSSKFNVDWHVPHQIKVEEIEERKSSLFVSGKRKHAPSQSTKDLKSLARNCSAVNSWDGADSSLLSVSQSKLTQDPVVLKSAFWPPPQKLSQPNWTHNPPMIEYSFIRTTAEFSTNGDVKFTTDETAELESITIAKDWEMGEMLSEQGESAEATGFVRNRYTK